MGKQCNVI